MAADTLNIMILAAGLGERLRPITDHIPKPLVPVLGAPVLHHVLNSLSGVPCDRIGINLHHKRESIEQWISRCSLRDRIVPFPEQTVLGTGGALKNAENFLSGGVFLVHNGDILSNINLAALIEHHHTHNGLVTLAVHDFPQFNTLAVDADGFLKGVGGPAEAEMKAFTGIAVYNPAFLEFLPRGGSSVVDGWRTAVGAGEKIGTCDVTGSYWSDIGTPASYAAAVFAKLKDDGESVYVHPSVTTCRKLKINGNVVIEEGVTLTGAAGLRNCIVLPGASIENKNASLNRGKSGMLENCILGPDFSIALRETDIICMEEGRHLIGTGGSDRKYFRIEEHGETAVLMQCLPDDSDFERHMHSTSFFRKRGVPVPELKRYDSVKKQAVFEDAGDLSLYSWLTCPRDGKTITSVYKRAIDGLVRIHRAGQESSLFQERTFDSAYFRWETDYFVQRFVKGLKNLTGDDAPGIDRELNDLAELAASFPRTVIHRDFQSQNIMILNEKEIRIIDFQGARMGPPAYDVASLLWDPYYRLRENVRNVLQHYYMDVMTGADSRFDQDAFLKSLLPCRLQRHMQALGAYGFLAKEKGKRYFLKFVPEGLRLLKEDLTGTGGAYPELQRFVQRLEAA